MAQAYKVDFTTRTVTITAEFEKAMSNPEAAEYKIIRQLCADFPGMRIVKRTHRTPTHYTSKNGEKSACNPYKNLTYEKMERFMDALPNGAEYRKQYDFLKSPAAAIQTNGYSTVREWFIAQFPLYRKNPLFYLTETPKIISGIDFAKQQARNVFPLPGVLLQRYKPFPALFHLSKFFKISVHRVFSLLMSILYAAKSNFMKSAS